MKNNIVDNGNGTSTVIIDSKKHGINLILIDTDMVDMASKIRWCVNDSRPTKAGPSRYAVGYQDGKLIKMHRYLLNTPRHLQTDHINGDRLDNRLCNLRGVSNQENSFNQKNSKGYSYNARSRKWQAHIKINGKLLYLGLYATPDEAHAAYVAAKTVWHKI